MKKVILLFLILLLSSLVLIGCVSNGPCVDDGHVLNSKCVCRKCNETIHQLNSDCSCINCGEIIHTVNLGMCEKCNRVIISSDSKYVNFGSYPQSEIKDPKIINLLNSKVNSLPSSIFMGEWSRGNHEYMYCINKNHEGEKYCGVYFTGITNPSTTKVNGYSIDTIYWFKYEPIKWRILSKDSGNALVFTEMIIDGRCFYPEIYDNRELYGETIEPVNWAHSTIRKWLSSDFASNAFVYAQKSAIVETKLDNKTTAVPGSLHREQSDTTDTIFLLSYKDMVNKEYGFKESFNERDPNRQKKITDYARIRGVSTEGNWWTRSPYETNPHFLANGIAIINTIGSIDILASSVDNTMIGVVPAMIIKIA